MQREFSRKSSIKSTKSGMRTFTKPKSMNKSPSRNNPQKIIHSQSRNKNKSRSDFNQSGTIDLAPFVRKNKQSQVLAMGLGTLELNKNQSKADLINKFLYKCIKSKDIKKAIKEEQYILDEMVDLIYAGKWNDLDLKRMFLFFVECFKKKVHIY